MRISIVIVRALVEELELRGHSAADFCQAVALPVATLDDPTYRVDAELYAAIVDRALSITRDERLGLRVGARVPATAMHVIGRLAVACRTLREAAAFLDRYSALVLESASFELVEGETTASFVYEHPVIPERHRAFDAEYCLAVVVRIARSLAPNAGLLEVRFRHAKPDDDSSFEAVFGCPVTFANERDEILFEPSLLDVVQRHDDPSVRALLVRRADELLAELAPKSALPARVRDLLRTAPKPAGLDADAIAEALGLTERTLRRRLVAAGVSLRELVERVLEELACAELDDPERPIKEVAYRLGFSESSAFHRAFKRWTGKTPVEYRESPRSANGEVPAIATASGESQTSK